VVWSRWAAGVVDCRMAIIIGLPFLRDLSMLCKFATLWVKVWRILETSEPSHLVHLRARRKRVCLFVCVLGEYCRSLNNMRLKCIPLLHFLIVRVGLYVLHQHTVVHLNLSHAPYSLLNKDAYRPTVTRNVIWGSRGSICPPDFEK